MKIFSSFLAAVLAAVVQLASASTSGSKPWPLVPWPQSASWGDTTGQTIISSHLKLVIHGPEQARSFLERAWKYHLRSFIFFRDWPGDVTSTGDRTDQNDLRDQQPLKRQSLDSIVITVTSGGSVMEADTNETYRLEVPLNKTSIRINAVTTYGVMRALQTFSLMVEYDMSQLQTAGAGTYVVRGAPIVVNDWPRYQHRGILVDTSRHYLSVASLRQLIKSMSLAKLNVLHWHAVDDESFPLQFQSSTIPHLDRAAFTPSERYTPADVRSVVAYGLLHGVRVVMEIDTPGHATSWCVGDESVCPATSCNQPLNPATPKTFTLLTEIFTSLKDNLPDSLLHLGADEVDFTCWTSVESIAKWMNSSNFTPSQAYLYYIEQLLTIAEKQKFEGIVWDSTVWSMFGSKLPKSLIIQVTYSTSMINDITAAGYRVIFTPFRGYYIDQVSFTWKDIYESDPLEHITDLSQAELILGGEVAMWGENVDASNLLLTIWPRTGAAAERFWSSRSANSTDEFLPRLQGFRCRLLELGFPAAPVMNPLARSAPNGPGSCSWQ